ncbi:MAG: antibiotic biosynthesis monooxygenase [Alphaproteobacteria bacterium]
MADDGVTIVTYIEVAASAAGRAHDLAAAYRHAARGEPGARDVEALQRLGRPGHFVLVETWRAETDWRAHAADTVTQSFRNGLETARLAPDDERLHHALSAGPSGVPGSGAVCAVTHVDVIPPRKDDGTALVAALAVAGRRAPGNLRFDAWTQTSRPNHMTLVEFWASPAEFEAWSAGEPMRAFRAALAPMSGALFDQRLYRAIG